MRVLYVSPRQVGAVPHQTLAGPSLRILLYIIRLPVVLLLPFRSFLALDPVVKTVVPTDHHGYVTAIGNLGTHSTILLDPARDCLGSPP